MCLFVGFCRLFVGLLACVRVRVCVSVCGVCVCWFVCVCATFTGRVVIVGDGPGLGTQPDGSISSQYACDGQHIDSYIKSCDIEAGRLAAVSTTSCPRSLVHHVLSMSSQLMRLWIGVGNHMHGIVMEFAEGVQYGEMLLTMAPL